MKHKILLAFVVVVLVGMSLTAVLSAQGDPAGSTYTCPDFGRLDYNYACQYGGWHPRPKR